MNDVTDRQPWSTESVVRDLGRKPFGPDLAGKLARALTDAAKSRHAEKRALINSHRDYCGHGLAYVDGLFHLIEVHDGIIDLLDMNTGELRARRVIASWDTAESFTEFWSKQSNYSCSGADPDAPLFATMDGWKLNNQRITRQRIERFLEDHPTSA